MPETEPRLAIDAVARCTRVCCSQTTSNELDWSTYTTQEAQKDGIFAGLSSGLVGGQC